MSYELGSDKKLDIKPEETALLIIDLQNVIVNRTTVPTDSKVVVDNAKSVAVAFNEAGASVYLITYSPKNQFRPLLDAEPKAFNFENGGDKVVQELNEINGRSMARSTFSALAFPDHDYPQNNLAKILIDNGIKTIVLCGISTDACIESTARDAFDKRFNVVVVRDCIAATNLEAHNNSLKVIERRFGKIRNAEEVISAIRNAYSQKQLRSKVL